MKVAKNTRILFLFLSLIIAQVVSACGVAQNAIAGYEEMRTAYLQVAKAVSDFDVVKDTKYAEMQANFQVVQTATANNEAAIAAWAQVESAVQQSDQALADATTSTGTLDLSKLATSNALLSNTLPAMQLSINSYTSSIEDIRLDSEIFKAMMATNSEALNSIAAAGIDWNAAVLNYNDMRSKVGNEVIAKLATDLGVADLPRQLPSYTSSTTGQPISNPLAPTKAG